MSALQIISKGANRNAPVILTVMGTAGIFVTAILTGKATLEAIDKVQKYEAELRSPLTKLEIVQTTWHFFIPPAIMAVGTSAAVIGMHGIHTKRATAILSAYNLTDSAFREYRSKVTNVLGERKELDIREELATDHFQKNPPPENRETVIIGEGSVLCLETATGRYFWSDMEKIKQAQNTINAQIIHNMYASQNEFYNLLGIPTTTLGDQLGWNVDALLEIVFGSELDPNGRPCLAMDYQVAPSSHYYKLH